jgi:hypothetical protein
MHSLKIGTKTYPLPSSWEELTRKQTKLCAELSLAKASPITKAVALWHLVPGARSVLKQVDDYILYEISQCLGWIWESRPVEADTDVTPMIQWFHWNGKRYYLPRASLLDVTIEEWTYVDLYLQEMMEEETREEGLIGLAATICRQRRSWWARHRHDFDGYPRIEFNPETIEDREKAFRTLPAFVLVAVQDFIMRSAEMLRLRYEPVFSGPASGGLDLGYTGLQINMADSGIFGTLRETRKANIHDVLLFAMKRELDSRKQTPAEQ